MGKTRIEWTEYSWNPVTGCSKVSPGCNHCYALAMSRRLSHQPKYALATNLGPDSEWSGVLSCHPEVLAEPLGWKKPRNISVCSMSDLFHDKVPWEFITQVFDVMEITPQHTYQVLTKRPGRMAYFAENIWPRHIGADTGRIPETAWPWNVWAGTSVESQKYAPRLECLALVPAKVRFVSVEPMLGPVDLQRWLELGLQWYDDDGTKPERVCHWVVCGGESGPGARPMHPDWVRNLRDQCQATGIPFWFKQWGTWLPDEVFLTDTRSIEWLPAPLAWVEESGVVHRFGDHHRLDQMGNHVLMHKIGKRLAGAELDGREWRERP